MSSIIEGSAALPTNAIVMEATSRTRDEIVALLFSAAMSGNAEAYARKNAIDPVQLGKWKTQYISDYVRYLEAVLYRIKDQIDY